MANNFASVLESLRAAGDHKLREVDSVYNLDCDWLLEQFKQTQTSLAGFQANAQSAPSIAAEQQVSQMMLWELVPNHMADKQFLCCLQSTAKSRAKPGKIKGKPADASAPCLHPLQENIAGECEHCLISLDSAVYQCRR